jgi:hypothetical protein
VVAGLAFEASTLRRRLAPSALDGAGGALLLRTAGLGARNLEGQLADVAAQGVDTVVVTGLAGGCAPEVAPGDVVVATSVGPTRDGHWLCPDPRLVSRAISVLEQMGLPHRTGRLLTTPAIVATPVAKAECWRTQGALAVDMESAHVLAWAARRGLPALAVRGIADGPADALPPHLARAIGDARPVRVAALLRWIRTPSLFGAAWRTWGRSRRALDRLGRFLTAFSALPVEP